MSAPKVTITSWTERHSGTLLGFCDAQMPSGMIFHAITVHLKGDVLWAAPSMKPMIGRDGCVVKDCGKVRWLPVVSFANKQARDQFSRVVVAALREQFPNAIPQTECVS